MRFQTITQALKCALLMMPTSLVAAFRIPQAPRVLCQNSVCDPSQGAFFPGANFHQITEAAGMHPLVAVKK